MFYRPDLTVLRGRPDVYVKGSFNRWKHRDQFGPLRMSETIPGGIGFLKTEIHVPDDAHVIDMVFSDTDDAHSGFYDNNKGFNYHIPVENSKIIEKKLKVLHVTVEMAPIAKVGGLADVVTALGRAVQEEGHDVEILMPKYDCIDYDQVENLTKAEGFNYRDSNIQIWKGKVIISINLNND